MDTVARRIEKMMKSDSTVRVAISENSKEEIARRAAILNNNLKAVGTLVITQARSDWSTALQMQAQFTNICFYQHHPCTATPQHPLGHPPLPD